MIEVLSGNFLNFEKVATLSQSIDLVAFCRDSANTMMS